ncbi:hypothetical protein ABBQ38_003497 [Trebouxia sp. C0009 RCD-2024]
MDWGAVQDLARSIQSKQAIPKDMLASTKRGLKSPSKSSVCTTLTSLDSITANCGPSIRSQLAEPRWIEMLLSVCCKNPTAALPICQLFSNWACSYSHEALGQSANAAIQTLRQRSAIIPPPAPLAHHMAWQLQAEVAQQGTPMLGFQRGFDFTTVDLWSTGAESSGSMGSQGHMTSDAQPSSALQVGAPMAQKLQAMQQGMQQLRKVDQSCQRCLDAGQAYTETEASQHMQQGWRLAKQCSSWANEVQVMVACEPVDSVLAILLQANDDLLAAVNSWDTTASRLVMLQSRSAAATSAPSQQPPSSRRAASPALSGSSSTNSASDLTPTTAASGGVFWSRLEIEPSTQNPRGSSHRQQAHQQQQQPQAESSHESYPSLLDSSSAQRQEKAAAAGSNRQRHDSSKMLSSSGYAARQQQQNHQQQPTFQDQNPDDARWHAFGAGASMPAALSSGSMHPHGGGEASNRAEGLQEFRGTVLNYRPAAPQHTDGAEQQSRLVEDGSAEAHSQGLQSWSQAAAETEPSRSAGADFGQPPLDPFAVSCTDDWCHTTDHGANQTSISAFDAFSSDPYPTQPPAAVLQTTSSTGQHSSAQQGRDSSFSSSSSAVGMDLPQPSQHLAGGQSDSALGLRKPSLTFSTGSRGPSLPPPHNLSTNSLSSLASGPAAATAGRGSDPASEQGVSSAGGNEGSDGETQKLRGQLYQMAAQHEEALRKMKADHEADVATIQAQAVAKMKELIEKVKEQTVKEREQAELRLQEAHQAEQNALAHLHSLRQDCRDKDALIAKLRGKLDQASSSSAPAKGQSHISEAERPASAGELGATSQGLDLAGLRDSPFGGVPRPKSAATSQQLPTVAPKGKKGRMLRAGSHLDKGAASLNSLQAYYRQPALRVRFTPGQLEELSKGVPGPSHKEWAATLRLPGVQTAAD